MADDHRPGAVYWIDHYVVPTNDMAKHMDFMRNVFGAVPGRLSRLTTANLMRNGPITCFSKVGRYHSNGGFLQRHMLPPMRALGEGTPRYGYFVRRADMDEHLKRLDAHAIPHTDPLEVSHEGEEGTTIYFADYDGNQYEFWAPRHMPPGAMESNNPLGVGRVSHVVLESRDLNRTEELISRFCAIDAIHNADVDKDTLPFRLEGGGRMIFKRVDQLDERTGTHNKWTGQHAALLIRNEEFFDSHLKLWDALPESELKRFSTEPLPDETNLPPRTELHGPIALGEHAGSFQRGTTFYDWDTNTFHFSGGIGLDGSMANYRIGHDDQNFPKELLAQAQG